MVDGAALVPHDDRPDRGAGLAAPVTVYRDAAGIPQIFAETDHDLFLAQGYVHAQDRFWEMDFRRHVTAGRLSELFGPSPGGHRRVRAYARLARRRRAGVALLDGETRDTFEAYADGVNAWILDTEGQGDRAKSLEYAVLGLQNAGYTVEPWTPSTRWPGSRRWPGTCAATSTTRSGARCSGTSSPASRWTSSIPLPVRPQPPDRRRRRGRAGRVRRDGRPPPLAAAASGADGPRPGRALDVLAQLPRRRRAAELLGAGGRRLGSNSWVIAGAHRPRASRCSPTTRTSARHARHLVQACTAACTASARSTSPGSRSAGLPGIVIGHNARIAWGFTNLGPDVTDLYLERIDGDPPTRYGLGSGR